jgi:hypothetical protein
MSAQVLIRKSDHFNSLWLFPEGSNAGLGGLLPRWLLLSVGLVKHVAAVGRQVLGWGSWRPMRGFSTPSCPAEVRSPLRDRSCPAPGFPGPVPMCGRAGLSVRRRCWLAVERTCPAVRSDAVRSSCLASGECPSPGRGCPCGHHRPTPSSAPHRRRSGSLPPAARTSAAAWLSEASTSAASRVSSCWAWGPAWTWSEWASEQACSSAGATCCGSPRRCPESCPAP